MKRSETNGISYLQFELLLNCPELFHAVFLRHGGASLGPFKSLNLGDGLGDDEDALKENMQRVKDITKSDKLVYASQVHLTKSALIGKKSPDCIDACDSLLCNERKVAAMIKHADCQASIFYDPINKAYCNVHAGWRGNVQNIYKTSIQAMRKSFGTKVEDLLVAVSPSQGPEHSEFINYKTELPEEFWQFEEKKNHFNLWEIAAFQLKKAGILSQHMEIARISTFKEKQDFFSFRRDKTCGRHASIAMLF